MHTSIQTNKQTNITQTNALTNTHTPGATYLAPASNIRDFQPFLARNLQVRGLLRLCAVSARRAEADDREREREKERECVCVREREREIARAGGSKRARTQESTKCRPCTPTPTSCTPSPASYAPNPTSDLALHAVNSAARWRCLRRRTRSEGCWSAASSACQWMRRTACRSRRSLQTSRFRVRV